ncbi:hypothetical protein YC2023_063659 [Brassica napus]
MRNKRCFSPPRRGLMFFWITSSFMYTSSINRIVTLSLFLDSIISLLCQPKQHWRRPLLPSGDPLPATNPHIETLCFRDPTPYDFYSPQQNAYESSSRGNCSFSLSYYLTMTQISTCLNL